METELADLMTQLLSAAGGGKWLLVVALGIAVLTRVAGWMGQRWRPGVFTASVLPWISCGLATASMVVAALLAGKSVGQAVIVGVIGGATASGLWSLLLKHLPLVGK